jgi:hypothetical protein
MLGFKSYRTAAVTLAGLELVHRIRKRQFKFGPGWWSRWSLKKQWDVALAWRPTAQVRVNHALFR